MTCLAGDVIGDYSFDKEIKVGDKLIFEDMAIYSMVKNNTFNGIPLPDIVLLHKDGTTELVRRFGYEDFKGRLYDVREKLYSRCRRLSHARRIRTA